MNNHKSTLAVHEKYMYFKTLLQLNQTFPNLTLLNEI